MLTFATLVLYGLHGQLAISYRAESIEPIARGDMAEGTQRAWELRCWAPTSPRPGDGVTTDELVTLVGATFRTIRYCLGDGRSSATIQRLHCTSGGAVAGLPNSQPLTVHLKDWTGRAMADGVFLQALHISTGELLAITRGLQQGIEAIAKSKEELSRAL